MNKIIFNITLALILMFSFSSCEDESKEPFPDPVISSSYVTFKVKDVVLDVNNIATSKFSGTFDSPSNNTTKHIVNVRRVTTGGLSTAFFKLDEITSFPKNVSYTAANFATALGQNVSDFLAGDRFDFECVSTGADGTVVTFNDLSANLQSEAGQKQGYRLKTFISCPFNQSDAIGFYNFTEVPAPYSPGDTFADFEVIAGAGPNQVKIINPVGESPVPGYTWELVANIDPATGVATVVRDDLAGQKQSYFWYNAGGFTDAFFETNPTQTSFFFSCTGTINFIARVRVSDASGNATTAGFSGSSFKAAKI